MKKCSIAAIILLWVATIATGQDAKAPRTMLVIHGGAGTITRASMTPQTESRVGDSPIIGAGTPTTSPAPFRPAATASTSSAGPSLTTSPR